jgi:hypothetical protein
MPTAPGLRSRRLIFSMATGLPFLFLAHACSAYSSSVRGARALGQPCECRAFLRTQKPTAAWLGDASIRLRLRGGKLDDMDESEDPDFLPASQVLSPVSLCARMDDTDSNENPADRQRRRCGFGSRHARLQHALTRNVAFSATRDEGKRPV